MAEQNEQKNGQNEPKLTPVSDLGEFGLIRHLTQATEVKHASTMKGIGDDAAIINNADRLTVVSTDLLIEGIHFDLVYTPLQHLGYKAVVVNLSDIYAMNAIPKQITVSIAVSSRFPVEALDELYAGIHRACKQYEVDLVGGDTSASRKGMLISITAIGEAQREQLCYRDGAKVGDLICLSGDLGAAYLGLQILEREKKVFLETNKSVQPDLENQKYLIGRLLKPEARGDVIDLLKEMSIIPTSMIDISDGLSSEIMHICEQSKVGCRLFEENVPIHTDTYDMAMKFKINPITCALSGGEDYELLFTLSPEEHEKLKDMVNIATIGKIVAADQGIKLVSKGGNEYDLIAQGWQHGSPSSPESES